MTRLRRAWIVLWFCGALYGQRFVILGDRTGSVQPGVYEQVWREVAAEKPEFVLTVGDLIEGLVDAKAAAQWEEVQALHKPYAAIPLFLTPGNHDIWSEVSEQLFRKHSGRAPHYSFDRGQAHFTVLDNSRSDEFTEAELAFLEGDLKANASRPVKVIVSHRPSWILRAALRDTTMPVHRLAKRYGVRQVIAGHVHQMIHLELDGVDYVSLPSAGGHLRASGAYKDGWFFGYTVAEVKDGRVTLAVHELKAPHGQGRVTALRDWGMLGLARPTLRALAEARGVRMGAAVNPARLTEAAYAETLAREFNQAEPENAMKFGPIHPGASSYNFGPADAVVEFAWAHGMAVRGHTLVWHQQNPQWVNQLTPGQRVEAMQEHIRTVVGRYAGKVYGWDVVNEAFLDSGTVRRTVWYEGLETLEQAFRWARSADPKGLLFYNDYGAEGMNAKADAIYRMARDFRARGVPIDGVGMQMHLTLKPPAMESIEANMRRLTELGLEVQITELDVRVPADASPADLAKQAEIYRDVAAVCLKFQKCTAIQTWGFTDKYSWIPRQFPGSGAALLFDMEYRPKAAYDSVAAALRK